jgi:hypothetical protein
MRSSIASLALVLESNRQYTPTFPGAERGNQDRDRAFAIGLVAISDRRLGAMFRQAA